MRFAILATILSTFLAVPALALGPDPIHEPEPNLEPVSFSAPQSRVDRWRGTPYLRAEQDRAEDEIRNRRLVSDGELVSIPSLSNGEVELLRREALDKRLPITLLPGSAF